MHLRWVSDITVPLFPRQHLHITLILKSSCETSLKAGRLSNFGRIHAFFVTH